MEGITIVNETGGGVRVAAFRQPAAGGVTLVRRVVEVPGSGRARLPGEHYAVSLLCQLPSGYGRTRVVSFPGPPARFEVRQKRPEEIPYLAALPAAAEAAAPDELVIENRAAVPVQAFIYREDREIERSPLLAPGERFSHAIRPELFLVVVDTLRPGDELPPGLLGRAVPCLSGQTARVTGSPAAGFQVAVEPL